jgi:flagellar basal-body rod protein FlgB
MRDYFFRQKGDNMEIDVNKMGKIMDVIWERHRALASNIANVETPGYTRLDVDFNAEIEALLNEEKGDLKNTTPEAIPFPGQEIKIENEIFELSKNTGLFNAMAKIAAIKMRILESSTGSGS